MLIEKDTKATNFSKHDFRNQKNNDWEQFLVQLSIRLESRIDVGNI